MMARVFEAVFERVAGLDVHKAQVTACVRVPDAAGQRVVHLAELPAGERAREERLHTARHAT